VEEVEKAKDTSQADRRAAEATGFDDVMNDCCDSRRTAGTF